MFTTNVFTTNDRRLASSCIVLPALALGLLLSSSAAFAQQYKSIAPALVDRAEKDAKAAMSGAMRNPAFAAEDAKAIDTYCKKVFFPQMTQYNANALRLLGKRREELIKRLRGTNVAAAQAHLTKLTLGVMRAVARDNYHPAVRYNASLVLGMLDEQYPTSGANPQPPKVLAAATSELLDLLEQNEFNGVKVHPSVKVGALEGLERHVRFGLDAQYTDRATQAAMAVLAQDASALEVNEDVNNWMKCQAARVLVRQFKDGPNKAVHDALTQLIADEKMSLEDRCCIAGLLEKMKYSGGGEVDAMAAVVPLGKLAKDVVTEGAEVARDFEELILGRNPSGRRPGRGFGGRQGDTGPKLERRQLLSRLTQIDDGAKSLSEGLSDEDKQKLQSLTSLLTPVIDLSKDSKKDDLDVAGEVLKLEGSLDNLIASWAPAPAAAADEDEFE